MTRKTRAERQAAHRKAVDAEKRELRQAMRGGGHHYFAEWYRHYQKTGDIVVVDAMEEMWDELAQHDRDNPAPSNFGIDDGRDRGRDLESRRREARDLNRAAEIAEGARRKASGIGGGTFATAVSEPEPEEDEPDVEAEEYEGRRQTLMRHGLVSRMPAPPQQPRKKKRRGYSYPPFVG